MSRNGFRTFVHALGLLGAAATLSAYGAAAQPAAAEASGQQPGDAPETEYGIDWFDNQTLPNAGPIEYGPDSGIRSFGCFPYCRGPRLTANVGAVMLDRSRVGPNALITDFPTHAPLLSSRDIRLGTASGPRVELIRHLDNGCALEFSYFGIDGWAGSKYVLTGGVMQFPHLTGTTVPEWPYNEAWAYYGSDLHNAEINLSKPWTDRLSLLAGFRYAYLSEYAAVHGILAGTADMESSIRTYNNLFGMQLGADYTLFDNGGPLHADVLFKGGVYGNDAQRNDHTAHTLVAGDLNSRVDQGSTSFVGEVRLTAHFQLTAQMSIFGGYEAVWYDGVALAPHQFFAQSPINFRGTAMCQGSFIGLECNW